LHNLAVLRGVPDPAGTPHAVTLAFRCRCTHQTIDQNRAGVVASIDVLRARVELQSEQQRLIAAENQLAIDKLNLARVIGLRTDRCSSWGRIRSIS
jgi:hypothetical protein